MKKGEFRMLLQSAISGSREALEQLFKLYTPLINKYSFVNGKPDEDSSQYILLYVTHNIGKFYI